jgi:hypothetical protein
MSRHCPYLMPTFTIKNPPGALSSFDCHRVDG